MVMEKRKRLRWCAGQAGDHPIMVKGGMNMVPMYKKKQLQCPVCGFPRLIDSEAGTESEVVPEDKIQEGWHPDYFQKCHKCGNQIGIRKVS